MTDYPPTIIVVHPKERRSKCTVAPLRGKTGFVFRKYPHAETVSSQSYVRLGLDGPLLSADDADKGLLVLDGTWRWTEAMERDFKDVSVRSLPPWQTSYPRVSKSFNDPPQSLATIEAIYTAYTILGRDTNGLLDDYHWAEEFLRLNEQRL